jgi:hypothetical protein
VKWNSELGAILALLTTTACAPRHDNGLKDRLALAREYVMVSQREERMALAHRNSLDLVYSQFCATAACKGDLGHAIQAATLKVEKAHSDRTVQMIANHLTSHDLLAVISFYRSPEGQAILRASDAMSEESARLRHTDTIDIHNQLVREFCPAHADMCSKSGLGAISSRLSQGMSPAR